jgi:hypothetical protein
MDTQSTNTNSIETSVAGDGADSGQAGKARSGKKGAQSPEETLATREELDMPRYDLAFAADPLFHHVSESFDEGNVAGLLLNNLSFFGGCDLQFMSNSVPSWLVAKAASKPASAELNLAWTQAWWHELRKHAVEQRSLVPSLLQYLPEVSGEEDTTSRITQFVSSAAEAGCSATSGANMHCQCMLQWLWHTSCVRSVPGCCFLCACMQLIAQPAPSYLLT